MIAVRSTRDSMSSLRLKIGMEIIVLGGLMMFASMFWQALIHTGYLSIIRVSAFGVSTPLPLLYFFLGCGLVMLPLSIIIVKTTGFIIQWSSSRRVHQECYSEKDVGSPLAFFAKSA